nr:MAG TPA: hypothetical protein [Caudoviricetes sp.]
MDSFLTPPFFLYFTFRVYTDNSTLFATVNTLCEKYFVIIYKTWYYGCK